MVKLELSLRTFIPAKEVRFSKIGNTEVWFNGGNRGLAGKVHTKLLNALQSTPLNIITACLSIGYWRNYSDC